ncbi:bifunctional 3,4-dihydroxy-2-butanone-4-phosphate synthase/GTP cyclohydrolase II [Methylacidimicrobium sp. B4]|uniref:bifunctional 3,4-dihydroxy-2-butanone-4-phosphate synthase/GTP cyclohydrolase II n=1 Tax=Methylacidimicrobium sp. B4 TaxID=2796139 RepID=UPI001A8EB9F8|nr:bifunctional 3,4-dihydroxy-2-butanone-4-phosphate synthase/GTP cyclohydrolase II [Methylacidimicrobium sp. B4]QSR84049.1 bifunctional 3,4-dihydroxy-2-butanone-4-phosphate synthase/GTP cyclohydrolase II [Methylacidimicrobium sp. B4]
MTHSSFSSIEEAFEDLRRGKLVIVVDNEDRENEGDFIASAELCTPETINFMAQHGRGLICVPITPERADDLKLPWMVSPQQNTALQGTPFTVSVDYTIGTSTGISAADRAKTVRALADFHAAPAHFCRPGHIFPLRAAEGGVLRRAGHTEAAVDLMRLAGLFPAGVLVEILNSDGTMARVPDLQRVASEFHLKIVTIKDLIAYRLRTESLVEKVVTVSLPTVFGEFALTAFRDVLTGDEQLALTKGSWSPEEPVLTRVHSQCLTGDVFHSLRCDCGEQLALALSRIERQGKGILLYLRQEGRGIGLLNKLKSYKLQEAGLDTVEANAALAFAPDNRDYGIGCQILRALGVHRLLLLTNNPVKRIGIEGYGLEIVERIPLHGEPNHYNWRYLQAKVDKLGHLIPAELFEAASPEAKPGDG